MKIYDAKTDLGQQIISSFNTNLIDKNQSL